MLRGVAHETAPAATDIEHAHAALEPELAADEVEFRFLRLFQRGRSSARGSCSCKSQGSLPLIRMLKYQ
jgi:hypothetical protein